MQVCWLFRCLEKGWNFYKVVHCENGMPYGGFYHCCRKAPGFSRGDIRQGLVLNSVFWYNISMNYKSNNNVIYSCKYHVVWYQKYRRKVLQDTIAERLSSW